MNISDKIEKIKILENNERDLVFKIKEIEIKLNNEYDEKLEFKYKIEQLINDNKDLIKDYDIKIDLLENNIKRLHETNENLKSNKNINFDN